VRDARCARYAGQYSSHRLSSFLRAAFCQRNRPARLQGRRRRGCRPGRGLSSVDWGRLRATRRARPRTLSRSQGSGCAEDDRENPQDLSRAPRVAGGKFHRLRAPTRNRRSQIHGRGGGGRMSITQRPPIPSLIPESAPFSPEQRTWLNGLFAGMIALDESVTPLSGEEAAKLMPGLLPAPADDGAPWHDPAVPLPDRMKLAEGKPLPRRMMAAMAQQDCGQCGYNCKDYAEALFGKKEERLNLCVPGGKDTARMLKQLYQEFETAPAAPRPDAAPVPAVAPAPGPGRSRDNPVYATFLSRRRLNKEGSQK